MPQRRRTYDAPLTWQDPVWRPGHVAVAVMVIMAVLWAWVGLSTQH